MKKLTAATLLLILLLLLSGCSPDGDGEIVTNDLMPNEWGITLETEGVTPTGLIMNCHQSAGENVFELNTGSYYVIQKLEKAGWTDVEYVSQEYDIAWTSDAWIITKEGVTSWEINWEFLYGELPAGEYRIGKKFMNFRGPGDYDKEIIYTEFIIE